MARIAKRGQPAGLICPDYVLIAELPEDLVIVWADWYDNIVGDAEGSHLELMPERLPCCRQLLADIRDDVMENARYWEQRDYDRVEKFTQASCHALELPILLNPEINRDRPWALLDGYHRSFAALQLGRVWLPAVQFALETVT